MPRRSKHKTFDVLNKVEDCSVSAPRSNKTLYFPALTGVRALAAYLVFVSHYDYTFNTGFSNSVKRFVHEFHIGVTIFFVLSGFLITYRYYENFSIEKKWFKTYIRNRVARIYPMYFIFTVATFVYIYCTSSGTALSRQNHLLTVFIANLLLVKGFFSTIIFSGVGPGWSLTIEECFYISAPFIYYISRKYKLFYVQAAIITGFGFLLVAIFSHVNFYGFFANYTFMMVYTFLGRCFEFFVGIKLAQLMLRRETGVRQGSAATYGGILLIFLCPYIMSFLTIPAGWTASLHNPWGIVINNYLLPVGIAIFFYGLLTENTYLKKIFASPLAELLGKSSYIFYLIHLGIISMFIQWGLNQLNDFVFNLYDHFNLDWHSPFEYDNLNVLYLFVFLNIIAIFLFKKVEDPLHRYFRKPFLKNPSSSG